MWPTNQTFWKYLTRLNPKNSSIIQIRYRISPASYQGWIHFWKSYFFNEQNNYLLHFFLIRSPTWPLCRLSCHLTRSLGLSSPERIKSPKCMHCIICIYWCILGLRLKAYCWWFWCLLQFQLIFYQIYIISAGHAILLATSLISSGRSSLFFVTSYNDLSSWRVPLNIENIHWKSCKLERINVNRLVNDGHLEAGMNDFVNYVQ